MYIQIVSRPIQVYCHIRDWHQNNVNRKSNNNVIYACKIFDQQPYLHQAACIHIKCVDIKDRPKL